MESGSFTGARFINNVIIYCHFVYVCVCVCVGVRFFFFSITHGGNVINYITLIKCRRDNRLSVTMVPV